MNKVSFVHMVIILYTKRDMSILDDKDVTLRVKNKTPFTGLLNIVNRHTPNSLLISGGTIVREMVYPKEEGEIDVDMYVTIEASSYVLNAIKKIYPDHRIETVYQPSYDRSFLKKNGILMTMIFFMDYSSVKNEVQVMICSRPPIDVVTNFDLTCCQNWFDGTHIYGTHLEQTMSKLCMLQGDYVKSLIEGNSYITKRIHKYQKRGFSITLDPSYVQENSPNQDQDERKEMADFFNTDKYWNSSWEEIVVKYCLYVLLFSSKRSLTRMDTFNNHRNVNEGHSYNVGKPLKFNVNCIFYLSTRGYTIGNLISVFGLNTINLGNIFHNMFLHAGVYRDTPPIMYVLLKVFQNILKPSIHQRYVNKYNSLGPKIRFEENTFTSTVLSRKSNTNIPFNFNVPYTVKGYSGYDGDDNFNLWGIELVTNNWNSISHFNGIGQGFPWRDANPPPKCCDIQTIPYYMPKIETAESVESLTLMLDNTTMDGSSLHSPPPIQRVGSQQIFNGSLGANKSNGNNLPFVGKRKGRDDDDDDMKDDRNPKR